MKDYIDEYFCDHCDKDTPHECHYSGHERDSSGDHFRCLICGWWCMGSPNEEHEPPIKLNDD